MRSVTPPLLVAEVGCNHKGSMEIAKELILMASHFCKVDVVKFQKRTNKELLSPEEFNAPHPNPMHSYGATYGEHREFLELTQAQHAELFEFCTANNIIYSSSVWDLTSAKEIVELNPKLIKIPSACNLNKKLLQYLCKQYSGEIHISFGMTSHEEEERIISLFESEGRAKDLVVYSCTSGYPVAFEDVCLNEITRISTRYQSRVKSVGFSGHHLGIAVDIAAATLGAEWVERHFTLDRTWKGTDHAASLEPDGMRRLSRDLKAVHKALNPKQSEIIEVEKVQRQKLKSGQMKWDM